MKETLDFTIESTRETERRLELLFQISSQADEDLDSQLKNALKLTTQLLELEIGIISSIHGSKYTVEQFYPEDSGLSIGQVFELGNTYCSITMDQDDIVAIENMKESDHNRHPCYEIFSLESYIGIPIYIDGTLYGTINFSSSKPKKEGFLPSDYSLIQLLGQWAGATIKRKKIEKTLSRRKELYKLISSNTADLVILHDIEGVNQFISPSVKNILGFSAEELVGKNYYELVHPDDIQYLQETPHQALKKGQTIQSIQYRIRNKKEEYIWFESSIKPILNDKKEPVQLQSVSRDITERKKLEILFTQAQEMANVGGWELDLKSGEMFWTDEVYRIHDVPVGAHLKVEEGINFYAPEAQPVIQEKINRAIEFDEPWDIELPLITAKGFDIWVRAKGRAEFVNGKAGKLLGTFQDITRQRENEDQIKSQNKQLTQLTETRDKLYSIIAHDLKGAFFGITGILNIIHEDLLEASVDAEILHKLQLTQSSSHNAHQLLENLLDWVRIQQGELEPEFFDFTVSKQLSKSIDLLNSAAENKKIKLITDFEESKPFRGDPAMLATVFRNLISNAIKFSEEGDEIHISLSEKNKTLIFRVKDHGVGMPEKVRESLFNPSSRPKRAGTMNESGTGLGLLLCKDLVNLHNGSIEVKSEEGKGSEFIVRLPR